MDGRARQKTEGAGRRERRWLAPAPRLPEVDACGPRHGKDPIDLSMISPARRARRGSVRVLNRFLRGFSHDEKPPLSTRL